MDSQSLNPKPSFAGHTLHSTFLLAEWFPPLIHTIVSLPIPLPPKGSVALNTLDLSTSIGPHSCCCCCLPLSVPLNTFSAPCPPSILQSCSCLVPLIILNTNLLEVLLVYISPSLAWPAPRTRLRQPTKQHSLGGGDPACEPDDLATLTSSSESSYPPAPHFPIVPSPRP